MRPPRAPRVALGGTRAAERNAGFFYLPTVLTQVSDGMRVFAEENFGPIAAITVSGPTRK